MPAADLHALLDDAWAFQLSRDPYQQLRHGVPVMRIPPVTEAEGEEVAAHAAGLLARLADVDRADLGPDDRTSAALLEHSCREQVEGARFYWQAPTVTPYNMQLAAFYADDVLSRFAITSADDADRYLALLVDYAALIRSLAEKARRQASRGIRVPRPALPGVVRTLTGMRGRDPELIAAPTKELGRVSAAVAGRLLTAVPKQVEEVLSAYDAILAVLDEDYTERAPADVGWAQVPGGAEFYAFCVRRETTLDVTAEQLHAIGRAEVDSLAEQMAQVRADLGFSGTEAEFHAQLAKEPRLFASCPEEVEKRFLDHMDRLDPLLPQYFSTLPPEPYGVKRLDPALEAGMTYGYYEAPTPDRPEGRYRYNASNLETRSLLGAATLIFHELAPGHHFHIARQTGDQSLHPLRRSNFGFTAYTEGWAEYAASVAGEMGLYDDPYDRYGRLSHERFTAQRLVVDTGMNALGWSLQDGRDYMRANTTSGDAEIESETLRYSTDLPGQALAYRGGFLAISGLRRRAEAALGEAFDVRAFHEVVLGGGAMPLQLLSTRVDEWIEGQGVSSPGGDVLALATRA